jgi:hypothetical protein
MHATTTSTVDPRCWCFAFCCWVFMCVPYRPFHFLAFDRAAARAEVDWIEVRGRSESRRGAAPSSDFWWWGGGGVSSSRGRDNNATSSTAAAAGRSLTTHTHTVPSLAYHHHDPHALRHLSPSNHGRGGQRCGQRARDAGGPALPVGGDGHHAGALLPQAQGECNNNNDACVCWTSWGCVWEYLGNANELGGAIDTTRGAGARCGGRVSPRMQARVILRVYACPD